MTGDIVLILLVTGTVLGTAALFLTVGSLDDIPDDITDSDCRTTALVDQIHSARTTGTEL